MPPGGRVEARLAASPGGAPSARLEVRDDGPGVSPDTLPHLFERFYRGAETRGGPGRSDAPRRPDSAGLGLAIVREIAARHGGSVGAAAGEPRGLVVWVEIGLDPRPGDGLSPGDADSPRA